MDKKTLIGLLVVGVILFGFTFYNSKQQEKVQRQQYVTDSIDRAEHPEKYIEQIPKLTDSLAQTDAATDSTDHEKVRTDALAANIGSSLVDAMKAAPQTYTLENEVMKIDISSKGASVENVELKDYKRYDGDQLMLYKEGTAKFDMEFFIKRTNSAQINTEDYVFTDVRESQRTLEDGTIARSLTLRLPMDSLSGAALEYVYTIRPDNYMVDFDVNFINMEQLTSNLTFFNFNWSATTLQNERGFKNENMYTTIAYRYPDSKKIQELGASEKSKSDKVTTKVNWVSFKQHFFSSTFVAKEDFADASFGFDTYKPGSGEMKDFKATFSVPYEPNKQDYKFQFYFGPNKYSILKSYDMKFEKVIPLGGSLISWINTGFTINVLNWLGKYIANYGIIILILTVMIKLIILPLTYKSYMSGAKMRVLKPQMDELNERFPDKEDALKKQQATMELYKKSGVSPFGGCLPTLIQMPILFAMFRFFPSSIELRGQKFLWSDDLSSYDSVLQLPFDIPMYGDHVSLFALLMAVSLFFYSSMTYKQTASAGPQMAGMKFMTLYLMPVMMLLWFNGSASGLTYYYLLSQLLTIIIMTVIRYSVNEDKILQKLHANAAKSTSKSATGKKSKWQTRYEEAMKMQQQAQREQQQKTYGGAQKEHTAKPQQTKTQPPKKRRK